MSEKTPRANVWRHSRRPATPVALAAPGTLSDSPARPEAAHVPPTTLPTVGEKPAETAQATALEEANGDPDVGAAAAKDEPELTFWFAIGVLVASTVLVAGLCALSWPMLLPRYLASPTHAGLHPLLLGGTNLILHIAATVYAFRLNSKGLLR